MPEELKSGDFTTAKAKIVIVDPDEKTGAFISSLLGEDLFEIHLAKSGEEAKQAVSEHEPDLIIIEKELPDRAGLDLLNELLQLWPSFTPIMITPYPSHEFVVQSINKGVVCYLTKPFEDPAKVKAKVDLALSRHRLEVGWHKRLAEMQKANDKMKKHLERIENGKAK